MDNLQLIGVILAPLILGGILIKPQILLYFLVLDSWLIIRISQVSFFHPALTFNRILIYSGMIIIVLKRLQSDNLYPTAIKSLMTAILSIFVFYCFYSSYTYMHQFNFLILNNLIFYFLSLALLDIDFEKTFRHICLIVLIPVILLSTTSIFNIIAHMELRQRSFAGNSNQSALYVLFGICFLMAYREMLGELSLRKSAITMVICIGVLSVLLSLGRMVTIILIALTSFYFLKGYIPLKALLIVGIIATLFVLIRTDLAATYVDKLIRLPAPNEYRISKFDEDKMAAFTSGRSRAYKVAWKMFKQHPIKGIGYDRWAYMHRKEKGSSLHSRWLQILVETGIPGFVLYVSLFSLSFFSLWRSKRQGTLIGSRTLIRDALIACMIAFLFAGITANSGFTDRIFYLFLAMIATLQRHRPSSIIS